MKKLAIKFEGVGLDETFCTPLHNTYFYKKSSDLMRAVVECKVGDKGSYLEGDDMSPWHDENFKAGDTLVDIETSTRWTVISYEK